jgi:hypothetical protein
MNFDTAIKTKNAPDAKNAMIQRSSVTYGNKLDTDVLNTSEFSRELSSAAKGSENESGIQAKTSDSKSAQTKAEQKPQSQESQRLIDDNKENNEEFISGAISTTEFKNDNNSQNSHKLDNSQPAKDLLTRNINELLNTGNLMNNLNNQQVQAGFFNIAPAIDYTSINMSANDAKFFVNLVQNTDKTMQGIVKELQTQMESATKEIQTSSRISQTLLNTIKEGMKTNQPFRIDFGKDVSVILQIDKNGVISANFLPGNAAVEQYLRNNIDYLRQTFDEEKLPYNSLSYGEQKQKQEEKNKRNSKESA